MSHKPWFRLVPALLFCSLPYFPHGDDTDTPELLEGLQRGVECKRGIMLVQLTCQACHVNPLVTLGKLLLFGLWFLFPPIFPQAVGHSDGLQKSGQTHCLLSRRLPTDLHSLFFQGGWRGGEELRQRLNSRPQTGQPVCPCAPPHQRLASVRFLLQPISVYLRSACSAQELEDT